MKSATDCARVFAPTHAPATERMNDLRAQFAALVPLAGGRLVVYRAPQSPSEEAKVTQARLTLASLRQAGFSNAQIDTVLREMAAGVQFDPQTVYYYLRAMPRSFSIMPGFAVGAPKDRLDTAQAPEAPKVPAIQVGSCLLEQPASGGIRLRCPI